MPFSKENEQKITKNYERIVNELSHVKLVDALISKEVLSFDDVERIDSKATPLDKNEEFVRLLLKGPEKGFNEFIEELRNDSAYVELADQIETTEVNIQESTVECIEVDIIQKGPITVGYGGTIKINANIISNSTGSLKVKWQKTHNNCSTTLIINCIKYSGSSCDVNNPQLVINNVDREDAGIYKVEVISPTETKSSPGILLELYGDEADCLSKEGNNFFLLYLLCQKIATQAVRFFFDSKVPGLDAFLKQHKSNLTYQRSVYRCTKDQEAKLFPGGQVVVVSTDFDFTLLYKLIRNLLTAIPAPTCGWGNRPLTGHLNETDDIERIRHLRNILARNSEFEICDTDFSTHWTDLSQAIDRLSKGSLSTDVESMRTKKFEKYIKNEMEEDIRKELKEIREEFMELNQKVTECGTDIADNRKKFYNINDRHIPLNIRKGHIELIKNWRLEDKLFYNETVGFTAAFKMIQSKNYMTIIGGPGSGKTATARHFALQLEEQGWEVVPVCKLEDIIQYGDRDHKQVFVLDDVLGIFAVDMNIYNHIINHQEQIFTTIGKISKLLFTCRKSVYKESFKLGLFVTENVVDLESKDNQLTETEKMAICQYHCKAKGVNPDLYTSLSFTKANHGFPFLCKLFSMEEKYQQLGESFFNKPFEYVFFNRGLQQQVADNTQEIHNNDTINISVNFQNPQSPMMGTSDEIKVDKELLSKGTFISYDNCVYLAGACNVGKSTLASILIGEEISQDWKSTDGLTIYFGRNGIDLKNKEMVPLKQDFGRNVLSKVLLGKPDMTPEKPDTTHREEVLPHDSNKGNIIPETHTDTQRTDITVPDTGKDDVNITDPVGQQSPQNHIITTIQEDMKEQVRKRTYKMEIAPSDLVDFGGQRSFDMTHQLFMRRKGTFVLMFNGRIDFWVPLKEYKQGETTESILKHWVNSILSYCADDDDILPIIMFCATHSDDFNQEDRKDRKKKLIHDLGEIFKNHKRQHRIIYDDIFFINGQDKNDLEINKLKSKLVEVACKQKSWGKRMPMAYVPLDLQMSELRLHNMSIISKEELITLNKRNEDLALTDEQIKDFLNDQHSLGKIVYFDQHGLDNFINLQPQSLVNILRSFITAKCFWPEDKELKGILRALTDTGKIAKQDLLKLWSQKKFHQHMPNDDFKEFIIQVLVHLDILVEPRHYRQEKESKVQSYLVPCIVKRRLPVTNFSADKMICLSYTLLKSSIPTALSFKLIGSAINLWPLKETPEGICLYHQAAILSIDESNELHLSVEDDKVFVYFINKDTKSFITPNMASVVQECLTLTMTKVLEFYHKSFGNSTSELSKAFEIEVGEWCTSWEGCYISVPELKEQTEWRCKNNKTHQTKYPRYWIFDKKQVKCGEKCPGLDKGGLELHPGDKHFFRLANLITLDECDHVVTRLGLSEITWNDIKNTDRYDIPVKKGVALCKWRYQKEKNMSEPSFQELFDALAPEKKPHALCQLFMEDVTVCEIPNSALQEIPEDDVLQDLSKKVGNCAMHLGVELGLSMAAIEGILLEYPKSMYKQNFGVMKEWKSSSKVKATIRMLMKAFQWADGRGVAFFKEKYMGNSDK